jgi:Fe-S cluster biosynthesis and repair protein YggX
LILKQLTSTFDHEPVPENLRQRIFAQVEKEEYKKDG